MKLNNILFVFIIAVQSSYGVISFLLDGEKHVISTGKYIKINIPDDLPESVKQCYEECQYVLQALKEKKYSPIAKATIYTQWLDFEIHKNIGSKNFSDLPIKNKLIIGFLCNLKQDILQYIPNDTIPYPLQADLREYVLKNLLEEFSDDQKNCYESCYAFLDEISKIESYDNQNEIRQYLEWFNSSFNLCTYNNTFLKYSLAILQKDLLFRLMRH
ncbi:MAG: hypothetical protein ACLRFH_00860 [Opitutales bacterium]